MVLLYSTLSPAERKYLCAHIVWEIMSLWTTFSFSVLVAWIGSTFNQNLCTYARVSWICQSMAKLIFLYCSAARRVLPPASWGIYLCFSYFLYE